MPYLLYIYYYYIDRDCPHAAGLIGFIIIWIGDARLKQAISALYHAWAKGVPPKSAPPTVSVDDLYSGWTSQGMDLPYLFIYVRDGLPWAWTCLIYL